VFRRDPREEIDAELGYHVDERARDYIERGMEPSEARRAALERVGDAGRVRDECAALLVAERKSEQRRVRLSVSWLDVKLGIRMLVKYPGLSVVSVIGMAVAIAVGAGAFAFIQSVLDPSLPFEEGDRIVALQTRRADDPGITQRPVLDDFLRWRAELTSVRDLGAFRTESRTLVTEDGSTSLVRIAEMSAAGFRVARVPALVGRTLEDEDERVGSSPVAVIAYEEWQRLFEGDPDVIGRTIRLGEMAHTVVGVMPQGFRFPLNHRYWIPLRLDPAAWDRRPDRGWSSEMFGRLTDGVTLGQAKAELAVFGQRTSAQFPETHEHLRPTVVPFTHPAFDIDTGLSAIVLHAIQVGVSLLLILVAVNVAVLVYARTATRNGEIAVRTALGASRRRVLGQLFVEGLVLSTVAAAIGLATTAFTFGRVEALFQRMGGFSVPFWWSLDLTPGMIAYVAALAVLGGAIVGVVPALEATGPTVHARLQQLCSRGAGPQLGRKWTTLIVVQVAITVAILPAALYWPGAMLSLGAGDPGYAIDQFVHGRLTMERQVTPSDAIAADYERAFRARFADRALELERRLDAEPGVQVTFASSFPGSERLARIEVEGIDLAGGDPPSAGSPERTASVDGETGGGMSAELVRGRTLGVLINHVGVELFAMFDVPVVAGRGFVEADTREGSTAVIVDRNFADRIANGANVIGRRIRYVVRDGRIDPDEGRWHEIVGVIPSFPAPMLSQLFDEPDPKVYHAATPSLTGATQLIVHTRDGRAASMLTPVRDIAATVDPTLQLHDLTTARQSREVVKHAMRLMSLAILIVTGSVLLLSAAGIYAMMSFTVARRRREIGIRSALGAEPRRILGGIFARAGAQIAAGAAIGLLLATALEVALDGTVMGGRALYTVPAVIVVITAVGLLSALGPPWTRRSTDRSAEGGLA
jgi:predicted permease